MNTEIQPFEFEHNQVRALTDGDEVMFVASDIAKILGYCDAAALTRTLDDEEKGTRPIGTLGGTQQLSVIPEPGLYKAILQRQTGRMEVEVTKAFVKRFQRWVTYDVLPSIRKHDAHVAAQTLDNAPANHGTTPRSFIFDGRQVRTIADENGNVLFCAKDVAIILGYTNPNKAIRDHTRGERIVHTLQTAGGMQEMQFVTEGDIYRLITSSKLPAAERFERWIYDEVLPTIRKHGIYATETTIDQILTDPDFGIRLLTNLKEERAKRIEAENQIKELEPKAKALDDFTNVPDTLLIRDAAKLLSNAGTPIGEKQLREWLNRYGWTYRHSGTWWAASERVKAGHLVMVESRTHGQHKDGSIFAFAPTVKITRKGLTLIHKRLGETRLNETLENTTH